MAKQKKRADGRFKKTFTFEGKRYYVYGQTQTELFEKEAQKRKELEEGREALYNPTLKDYYNHFTTVRRREIKGNTLRSQLSQFNAIAAVEMTTGITFGDMQIKKITRRDIEAVRETMLKSDMSPENLNIYFAHLNHVFRDAEMHDIIEKNPCRALKALKRETPHARETIHRALTDMETKAFFYGVEARNSFYKNAFLLMMKTGMRIGEIGALYRTDIDKKNGFIHVRRTITRTEEGAYLVGDDAKTQSGVRDIPMTDEVYKIILEQEELNRSVWGLESEGLLFRSSENQILREYTINREIKRICKEIGIDYFTCHAFRATFATRFIEQRPQDYKALSEILGHKDVSITLNLYTHTMTETKVRAMQELNIKIS